MSAADYDWGVSGDLLAQLREAEAKVSRVREMAGNWTTTAPGSIRAFCGEDILRALDGAS